MGGWNIPPFMPPFLPPNVTSTASIREVRDSESERDQRTTAGRSNDSSGDDAEYIRQQRDRLQNLRGNQTTNQVPSNPQAPPIAQTPVGHRTQETSQGAYAGETRQRPREDRREQVRTTLPMHGEPAQPGPTQQALMQEQAPPGIRHSKDQSSRRDWFSGSSSSDEWEMETPVSRRSRSKGKRVVSKEQKKSERIVQVIKTFASWKISFDGEPKGRKDKAEEFLASVKECMEAIDLSDAEVLAAMPSILTDRARTCTSRKVASTELEEATGQVAGLTVGNKPEAKAQESKPQPATTPANPANADGGQKGKGRGRRGGKKNENGTSAGAAAETAAVTTNATKPASTSTPTPSAPPPPTPPAPQAGPWGYPWGFPPYPGKRTHPRTRSEWTPEIALQIRRDRIQARDNRRAMEREYERLSARHRESERPRHQEHQQPQRQEEPMLRHDDASKRRRRNPNRHMTLEDHVDYQAPVERDYSPPPGPATLAQALPGPADPLQAEIHRLAEEAARVARLEDQSPPATARPPTPEQQSTEPRRIVTPTARPGPTRRGTRFQWLEALPLDEDDPPPHTCFRCWKSGHISARCPAPKPWFHCFNCGRRRVAAHNCPRCATAYAMWEGRPAHEARFGPSATVTRPPQEPERQPAPMEIERVREQPNQSAAVSQPPSTPPPSATTRRQDEREPTRPPTTPPPARDSGAERTTTLPRPFPVLPEERHIEAPAIVAPVPAPRTRITTVSATPPPNIAAAAVNSSASASITMPIPGLARLMAAMTPADHEEFRLLVTVAVTMPQSVQEQMYAAFFDRIRQAQ
ncbi:hypothetical protein QAD02_020616 [Eretmocerus hayati]|uniref:Uncharacterized protein n=1 Tax=Eretmocerus hayati TaxID=131215 RepID=A0ACC2PP65_9HYME|nr:hypothetical protein QAD02_020616 [Eretmocerus hayati]